MRGLLIGLALILGVGCSVNNTSIEQSWTPHAQRASQLRRVVTMFGVRDGVLRRTMEDRMAVRLAQIGVRATPGYRVLTEEDRSERKNVIAKLRAAGYDGVIVMRVIGEPKDAPESFDAFLELGWPYGDGDLGTIMTVVRMEATAYSLRDNQLVWSALTKTVDPEDLTDMIDEVTRVVTRDLERRAVVEES